MERGEVVRLVLAIVEQGDIALDARRRSELAERLRPFAGDRRVDDALQILQSGSFVTGRTRERLIHSLHPIADEAPEFKPIDTWSRA